MEWQKICKGDYVKRVKDRVFLLRFESKEFSKYFVLYTKTLSESKLYEIKRFRVQNSAIAPFVLTELLGYKEEDKHYNVCQGAEIVLYNKNGKRLRIEFEY